MKPKSVSDIQIFKQRKMEVIRDAMWSTCLANAVKMYRLREPNEKCYRLADATWKCKMSYIKHDNTKRGVRLLSLTHHPRKIHPTNARPTRFAVRRQCLESLVGSRLCVVTTVASTGLLQQVLGTR